MVLRAPGLPRLAVLAVVAAALAVAACGKKDDPLADRFRELCNGFVAGGATLGQVDADYFGLARADVPCGDLVPLPAGSNDQCGPVSIEAPICEYVYVYRSTQNGDCFHCEVRARPPALSATAVVCATSLFTSNCF